MVFGSMLKRYACTPHFAETGGGGPSSDSELGIRGDGGLRVAGHFHFRDHLDVAFGRVRHDVADLRLGVEAAVFRRFRLRGGGGRAAASYAREARVFADFDAPALVVREVPVEGVEFVPGHPVEHGLDELDGLEVAGGVEHQAAPGVCGAYR